MKGIMALSDEVKIAIVSAVCLLGLVIVLKNVLKVPAAVLSHDIIIYIIIYSGFWLLPLLGARRGMRSKFDRPLTWSLLILAVTLGIIAVYAI